HVAHVLVALPFHATGEVPVEIELYSEAVREAGPCRVVRRAWSLQLAFPDEEPTTRKGRKPRSAQRQHAHARTFEARGAERHVARFCLAEVGVGALEGEILAELVAAEDLPGSIGIVAARALERGLPDAEAQVPARDVLRQRNAWKREQQDQRDRAQSSNERTH